MTVDPASGVSFEFRGVRVEIGRSLPAGLMAAAVGAFAIARLIDPQTNAGHSALIAMIVAIALGASLLAHELGHARAAVSRGLRVSRIRFWGLGALCERADVARAPLDQLYVVAAGPAANVLLALTAWAATLIVGDGPSTALRIFAAVNALVAATNLIPILPFDGGQIVAALLWHATGDSAAAYQRMARVSRMVAAAVLMVGLAGVLSRRDVAAALVLAGLGLYLLRLPLPKTRPEPHTARE